jgi:predicted phosphodiesterase
MKKLSKEQVVKKYQELAVKLAKLPSVRDCKRLGLSERQITNHFGKLADLKAEALAALPELEKLCVPARLTTTELEDYRANFVKLKVRKDNKKLMDAVSVLDYIEEFSDRVFSGRIKPTKTPPKGKMKRVHTLMLSDLHFGADISAEETSVDEYSTLEESRRFAAIIKQASEYKPQYRKQTKLVVALIGDIIENSMHDPRTGAELSEQICRAIHLLAQGVGYLAQSYGEVEVVCAAGNHDRNTGRHPGRAIHAKYDGHSTVIYYAVKKALSSFKNVKFTIPKSPLSHYTVFGKKIAYTHGDTVIQTGGIYSTVNVKNIEAQVNKINAALKDEDEYAAILYGHTHIGHVIHLSNGTVLIGNGALPPPDPFAVSLGNFESNNGQWIFESVEGFAVGDLRFIRCGRNYDSDEALDKIIKPWENLNE